MKNNKGFMLVEALVMSTIIIGTLTFMYIQFQNISRSYERSFNYNSVTNLYIANEIKEYLTNNELLDSYKDNVKGSESKYVIINISNETLIDSANINAVMLADEALSELKGKRTSELSDTFNDFINYVKVDKEDDKYRLLIEFKDNTYASLKIGE